MELCQGRGSWELGTGGAPEGGGHGTGCPGQWARPQEPEYKECLDSTLRHRGWILGGLCEAGVGLSDLCGSLPTQSKSPVSGISLELS